ncbi:sugar phosphate isomerase/epimerase family protein [Natronosalvus vescus]|uniref:sugar phosphate isomerase/epimerase family protein n=1 Tax=Natronosalvus vescus TaxID=2953881 RepID=UPI00209083CC|nr:sugar phosphate isomerase/epimerase [Natronosalvus vescus]
MPLPDVLEVVAATGVDGVEFAGLGETSPRTVARTLEEIGLEPAAAHVPIDDLEEAPAAVADTYHTLGCTRLVVPWLDPEAFESRQAFEETATRLGTLGDVLASGEIEPFYHDHDQEFVPFESEVEDGDEHEHAFDLLATELESTPVAFELDIGWATPAGGDPIRLLERYGDRIDLVHLKVVDGDSPCTLGTGDVPLARSSTPPALSRWTGLSTNTTTRPIQSWRSSTILG